MKKTDEESRGGSIESSLVDVLAVAERPNVSGLQNPPCPSERGQGIFFSSPAQDHRNRHYARNDARRGPPSVVLEHLLGPSKRALRRARRWAVGWLFPLMPTSFGRGLFGRGYVWRLWAVDLIYIYSQISGFLRWAHNHLPTWVDGCGWVGVDFVIGLGSRVWMG